LYNEFMNSNEYMNSYMKDRWVKRRKEALLYLGDKCVLCDNSNPEDLQFDHIDPTTKTNTIARLSSASEERFWSEVDKCQLLCKNCHYRKTMTDLGVQNARETHGTLSSYRYCRCDICKEGKSRNNKEYKLRKKRAVNSVG